MKSDLATAAWRGIASIPGTYYLAAAVSLALAAVLRGLVRARRKKGSIRPIGYFSYITHSSLPAVCARCGAEVPDKTKKYCLSNAQRFGGMVYCEKHQRRR